MQKKIIVLAIAAALITPALAFADATVYGQVNLSVDMVKDGAATGGKTYNQLNSNTSRIGLKGSEDLGSGLSAIWQMEGVVGADTGTTGTSIFNRNTFLGLSSSMGTVLAGRHDTPYKLATRKLDLFLDGIADNRGQQTAAGAAPFNATAFNGMGGGHDARLTNVLAYVSPTFSGVSVLAATVFGGETAATVAANDKKGSAYSLAGMFEQGPIYAALAYQVVKVGNAGTGDLAADTLNAAKLGGVGTGGTGTWAVNDETKAIKLGGSYTMDKFAVNAVVEKITDNVASISASSFSRTDIYLAGKFNVSETDAAKLAITKIGDFSGMANSGGKQYTLGFDHGMSKFTTVYALYTKLTPAASGAATPSALSVGMKHSF